MTYFRLFILGGLIATALLFAAGQGQCLRPGQLV
jgi:hypothetical protein